MGRRGNVAALSSLCDATPVGLNYEGRHSSGAGQQPFRLESDWACEGSGAMPNRRPIQGGCDGVVAIIPIRHHIHVRSNARLLPRYSHGNRLEPSISTLYISSSITDEQGKWSVSEKVGVLKEMTVEGSFSLLAAARHFTLRTAARPLRLAPAENDVLLAAAGREGLVEYIRDAYRDPAFAQAVVHAAPALWESVQRALGDPASMKPNRLRRVALSTRKFLNRISSRPTPFGLFAGVSVGEFAGDPEDSRVRFTQGRREAVADFRWLSPVVRSLEQRLEVLKGLTVCRNPLLRWRANEILVFGADRADVSQSRTAIGRTPVLDCVLDKCSGNDGIAVEDLCEGVAKEFHASPGGVLGLVARLVGLEILYTSLKPKLTGGDPLEEVVRSLQRAGVDAEGLLDIHRRIRALSGPATADDAGEEYSRTYAAMAEVDGADKADGAGNRIHFVLNSGVQLRLPDRIRQDAEEGMHILQRLSHMRLGMRGLRKYHMDFLERYGIERTVPLLTLVDPARGIGVPEDYSWPKQVAEKKPPPPDEVNEKREERLAALYSKALAEGGREISLTEADIDELSHGPFDESECQLAAELYLNLAARSWSRLAEGDYRVSLGSNPGTHSSLCTTGRFLGLLPEMNEDPELRPFVDDEREYSASLSYYPRSHAATNLVNTRPLGVKLIGVDTPHAAGTDYVPLSRIGVKATMDGLFPVDMSDGRAVRIHSRNSVYTPAQAPNAVRFLADMETELQRLWEPWDWGRLGYFPFVPRVRHGRFVLSPARWSLKELKRSGFLKGSDCLETFNRWKERWGVPRHCLAVTMDLRLLLDTENPGDVELLQAELAKADNLVLEELPGGAQTPRDAWGWLSDGEDVYVSELVLSFKRRDAASAFAPERFLLGVDATPELRYLPGSQWHSFRLYTPADEITHLLKGKIGEAVERIAEAGGATPFFVRYIDGVGSHLRVRFQNSSESDGQGQPAEFEGILREICEGAGATTFVQDGYVPEFERYGGVDLLDTTHDVFSEDSLAVLKALRGPSCDLFSGLEEYVVLSWTETFVKFFQGFGSALDEIGMDEAVEAADSPEAIGDAAEAIDDPIAILETWTRKMGLASSRGDESYDRHRERWSEIVRSHLLRDQRGDDSLRRHGLGRTAPFLAGKGFAGVVAAGNAHVSAFRIVGSYMHMTFNRVFGPDQANEQRLLGILRSVAARLSRERSAREAANECG